MKSLLVESAKILATDAHGSIGQVRKYTGEPYIVHPEAAYLVLLFNDVEDEITLAAMWLHDVLEDVFPVNSFFDEARIEAVVGAEVLAVVKELTDTYTKEAFPNLNRVERKRLEAEAWLNKSERAKTAKLADLIVNTSDIVSQDKNFARTYLREKANMLPYLKGGNERLFKYAAQQLEKHSHLFN
jgi:(p)ppGpp synthase/HD superfamily hydrolase